MFLGGGKVQTKLFITCLSLVLLCISVSGIEIIEYDTLEDVVITSEGENIGVALIKAYIDEKVDSVAQDIDVIVEQQVNDFNEKIDEELRKIHLKIGIGIVTICLFIFNILLASKLLIEGVFKNA